MQVIRLTQGYEAYVDDTDYVWIMAIGPWYYHNGYAVRRARSSSPHLRMHNLIASKHGLIGASTIDHVNHHSLDNRLCNLRQATGSVQSINRRKGRNNTSGYVGVVKNRNRWRACITLNGRRVYDKTFDCAGCAALARDKEAIVWHGRAAYINLPDCITCPDCGG